MVDRPEHIFQFLPLNYFLPVEGEYVTFWWDTYSKNLEERNYHVAFLAFHMLYMTAVYFMLYKLSKIYKSSYEHSLFHMGREDEEYYLGMNSAFSFSKMNEKGVFRFLKIAGADHALILDLSKFIDDRNNAAHAKGAIFFKNDPEGLDERTVQYVRALEKIQNLYIDESKKIALAWKVSHMDNQALKIYLESEILSNSLSPAEISAIALSEKTKRTQVSKLLSELISGVTA
jgi:hypothetical protein